MSDVKYTSDHEWIRLEGDVATIGVSDYAQEQLGDVVYVDLPDVGKAVAKGAEAAVVESVKAASEVYAPLTGEIVEVNDSLGDNPGQINEDAEGNGWFMKIRISDQAELDGLMNADEYATFVESLS
ncbi:MAG: glycine cleavage system protein H [Alphaproteobacteria bacterium]|nr:glycine cleavage system protein H [Alphaproteobacteria bacterium]|tara:strand:- start:497 stop:874 length:378 start_codon:yes stop_codon:yes gene_type:complete